MRVSSSVPKVIQQLLTSSSSSSCHFSNKTRVSNNHGLQQPGPLNDSTATFSKALGELNLLHPVAAIIRCFIKTALRFHFKVNLYILNNVIILATAFPFTKKKKCMNILLTRIPQNIQLPGARRGVVKK
jgi:hypothetical protein